MAPPTARPPHVSLLAAGLAASAILSASAALPGCAARRVGLEAEALSVLDVVEAGATFRVIHGPQDARAGRQVADALARAAAAAQRFGPLSSPVTLTLHPSHEALERAVDRPGYSWLRAWARAHTVDLQSPRTWGWSWFRWGGRSREREVEELLVHELVHCAMFQAAGGEGGRALLDVPRWFSEGMASVAAGQGYRRASLADLRRHWRLEDEVGLGDGWPARGHGDEERRGDPLLDPDPLYRERADLVYGAAHHAFSALVEQHGDEAVRRVIARLGAGTPFDRAFREEIGMAPEQFAASFRAEVLAGAR